MSDFALPVARLIAELEGIKALMLPADRPAENRADIVTAIRTFSVLSLDVRLALIAAGDAHGGEFSNSMWSPDCVREALLDGLSVANPEPEDADDYGADLMKEGV